MPLRAGGGLPPVPLTACCLSLPEELCLPLEGPCVPRTCHRGPGVRRLEQHGRSGRGL